MTNKIRIQRNLLVIGFIILLVSNLILAIALYNKDTNTILVPAYEHNLQISTKSASSDYLKLRGQEVHFLIFGMNKENHQRIKELILSNIDHEVRNNVSKQLDLYSENIEQKEYYYNFSDITEYAVNTEDYQVKISGYLETYIGDERINREYKSYLYEFINRGGRVLLHSFKEVKEDE